MNMTVDSAEFAVTSRRVIISLGLLQRRTVETMLTKVEAISVDQSLNGRLFNYGTITVTGSVSIASNAPGGSPLAIPLSGTATQSQPGLTINPASVPFGNISVGSSSSQNVTLTNTGNATVNITGATASGAGFGLSGLGAQSINPKLERVPRRGK